MTSHAEVPARGPTSVRWAGIAVALTFGTLAIGAVASVVVASMGDFTGWRERTDIGDSFGVINGAVAGCGLVALIITQRLQARELAFQRQELELQRQAMNQSRLELFRTAEANLRTLHVELIKMSIADAELAMVWPPLVPGAPHDRERQYLYANLIYQHSLLSCQINNYTLDQWQSRVRYLFASPTMRAYWRAASRARLATLPENPEFEYAEVAERICSEYDELLYTAQSDEASAYRD